MREVPPSLWARGKYDVGLIKPAQPVVITPKSSYRPCKQQYPLKQEAIDGITPVFNSLLQAGVIVPCNDSPVRTPIFPVKKVRDEGAPTEWSVPVDPNSQFWFAFNFNGRPYTFTRLCQGYCESPTLYNEALRDSLAPLVLSPGPDDGEPHNCLAELQVVCSPRPDLSDTPLTNPDLILYVVGSATRDPLTGVNCVGFAVVSDNATLVSGPLPHHLSAQAAELVALTEACKFAAVEMLLRERMGHLKPNWPKIVKTQVFHGQKALPIVLMYMRMRRRARTGLSPYEVLFAAPPHIGAEHPREPPSSTAVCENAMLTYCINLSRTLSSIRQQVAAALPPPASKPLHSLHPGDFVVVKDFRRKHWQAKRWHGPFPDPPHHSHGCESGRTSNLDPRQPLQKGTSTCRITIH
ncbi:hypothetical protein L3Q82_016897 [Scortum barcoo]|uniref:Uncharacterized protein n=1 Tax=Scortum barcoo TaxID=214431 RepID=A0ACB8X907_9TELE|nr:hypothetical protein L3Q82_016897 [Scortum barcoo]